MEQVVYPYINFGLFLWVLWFFGRKSIKKMAQGEKEEFDRSVEEAHRLRDEALEQKARTDLRLASLDAEIEKIKEKARLLAEQEAKEILAQAERRARHIEDEVRRAVDYEVNEARAALRQEILTAVESALVERVTSTLAGERQEAVLDRQIQTIPAIFAGGSR